MKILTLVPLVALFLLLSLLIAAALPSNPVWAPSSTTFLTNSMPVVGNGTNAFSVIAADINGDGRLDLISAGGSASGGALTILTNNGNGFGSNATYTVGATLFSVTAADINGDASLDLICSMTNGAVLVLTNNGLGVFGSNATYITGPDPVCVTAVADLDGHGLMALVTANNNGGGPGTLTVLTNNGGGIYVSNTAYIVGQGPRSVVAADINGDGLVDLITANFNGNSLTVLTNNGNGKFVLSATLFTSINSPGSVAVADVNGDGRPDLICANFISSTPGTLTILTNNGNGNFVKSFTPGNFTGGLSWPTAVTAVTNFDGRGEMALIAANYGNLGTSGTGSTLTVLTNNGTGVFGSNATLHVGTAPASIAVGDFNGDGRMDLVSAHGGTNTLSVLFNVTAFYNVAFTAGAYGGLPVSATGSPTPVLTVSNAPPLPSGVLLIANTNGTGVLGGTPAIGSGGVYNLYLLASNINAGPVVVTQRVSVTINQQPIFQGAALGLTTNYTVGNEPYSVAVADVNGDGKPDLITANYNNGTSFGVGGTLTVLTNNGFGGFGSNTSYTVGIGPRCVIVVTNLDGRGLMALVSANYGSGTASTLTVLTNNGGGIFVSNTAYSTGQFGAPSSVTAADINGDGYVDLIAANYNNNTLTVFTNNGNGAFKAASTNSVGVNPDCVIAADLLGNGKMDLISANYNSDNSGGGTLSVLTNNGSGIFTLSSSPAVGQGPLSVMAADIYGNGRLALISGNIGNNNIGSLTVLTNNGKGIFGSNATLQANSVQSVTAVDINGDGHVDLVSAQNFSSSQQFFVDVYTNDGSGVFGISPLTYVAPGFNGIRPYSVVAADINGDGRVDLITANLNSGNGNTVTVLTNGVPTISPALTEAAAGNYTVLASGFPAPVFSENGALPGGVTFTAGGTFTGTPNTGTPGTYSVVVTSSNVFGISSQSVNLIITPAVDLVSNVFSTAENTAVALSTNSLLANATDLDGFLPLTLTAVAATSTNGGTVVLDGGTGLTTYTPVSGFTGLDEFSYTVMDANSDTAQGTALVVVIPPGNPSYNNMATTGPTGTQLGLQYTGVPGQPYYVQSATNVAGPYTDVLPVVTANSNGLASKTIIILLSTPARYYRVSNTP